MPRTNLIAKAKQLKNRLNGTSTRSASTLLGVSHSSIAQTLALLKLSSSVQKLLQEGQLSKTHARLLCSLPPEKQLYFASLAVAQNLSVRALETTIKDARQRSISPDTERLERLISEKFSVPIRLDEKKKQLIIKYQSLEILDGLLQKIGVDPSEDY